MKAKKLISNRPDSAGFSLADVAIASAIFAGVLIVCMTAFLAMGRIYFRGSVEARVQESARSIIDDIGRTIATTAVEVIEPDPADPATPPNPDGWKFYCIAGIKYSFLEHKQLERRPPTGAVNQVDRVFIKSIVKDGSGNPTGSCDAANLTTPPPEGEGIELLDYRTRIHDFDIDIYGRLHVVRLELIYGGNPDSLEREKEVFEFIDPTTAADPNYESNLDATNISASDYAAYGEQTRCELTETFCYITRGRREVYQTISE